jgi:uncharacterized protein YlaI
MTKPNTRDIKYFCDKCHKQFTYKSQLLHCMIPHLEMQSLNTARLNVNHIYLCNECVRDVLTYIKIGGKE